MVQATRKEGRSNTQLGTTIPVALIVHLSSFQISFPFTVISKNIKSKGRTLVLSVRLSSGGLILSSFSWGRRTVLHYKAKLHNYHINFISLLGTFEDYDCYHTLRKARAVLWWPSPLGEGRDRVLIHRKIIPTLVNPRLFLHDLHQHIIRQTTGAKTKPFIIHPLFSQYFFQHH